MMDSIADARLDTEFDEVLVEMKPHVLRLPHKTDRQKCAVWIKKFCEPPTSGGTPRKTRNSYAQLLLHMLRKGELEGPFTGKPQHGALPGLPSYMSVYFEDDKNGYHDDQNAVPDWVAGELGSELTSGSSIAQFESLDSPPIGGQYYPNAASHGPHFPSSAPLDQLGTEFTTRGRRRSPSPRRSQSHPPHQMAAPHQFDPKDWTNSISFQTTGGNSLFADESTFPKVPEPSLPRGVAKEMELRTKMAEAKFQEERLRLQQKHDGTVQKILDRKNAELEELKRHYRAKAKEQEENNAKLERKLTSQHKELVCIRDTREQEVNDLKKAVEEANTNRQQELDKKVSDLQGQFEEEKFMLQKQHTKNIQDLLDDTNSRLSKMEGEYSQQMEATAAVIRELENRVQQLGGEAESLSAIRNQLEREKVELEGRIERVHGDLTASQDRYASLEKEMRRQKEDSETELRTQKQKHDSNVEHIKQEHSLAMAKANDKICDYEQKISHLKQSLENSELQRQNDLRDVEHAYQQDKQHLESLHDKKVRNLQQELDQTEQEYQKKVRKLEQTIRDKEDEVTRITEAQKLQTAQSEQALDDFKTQVDKNSTKMYNEMKEQMDKVEQDLHRSKQLREKQVKESQRALEEEKYQHQKQLTEMQLQMEHVRANLLREFHAEKEAWQHDKEQEIEVIRDTAAGERATIERKAANRKEKDAATVADLENQIKNLKDEVLQSNALRKQQLMELGLLREEEKNKIHREHSTQISNLKAQMEAKKSEAEKKHSRDMESLIEKTNTKLKEIETESSNRAAKANETISELQRTIQDVKNTANQQQEEAEHEVTMTTTRLEEEKRKMKHHHAASVMGLQKEVETQKGRCRQLERQCHQQEQDYEEKITQIRSQCEERLRGLVPIAVRQELEDTIASLKQQLGLVQQRMIVLQDDSMDSRPTNAGLYGGPTAVKTTS